MRTLRKFHAPIERTTLVLFCMTVAVKLSMDFSPSLKNIPYARYALPLAFWMFIAGLWVLSIFHLYDTYGHYKKPLYKSLYYWAHILTFLVFTALIMTAVYHSFFFDSSSCCLGRFLSP